MDSTSTQKPPHRKRPLLIVAIMLMIVAVSLVLASPHTARADGGGFPTSTPTGTRVPTSTPTNIMIIFPPTATWTQGAPALLQGAEIPQNELSQAQIAQVTEAPSGRSITSTLCIPLGVVAIVLAVVLLLMLRRRMTSSSPAGG